jgi:hypothetical protein
MRFVEGSVKLFAVGSLAFGVWGVIHPQSLTGLLGDDPELGRLLGARDLVIGLALFKIPRSVTARAAGGQRSARRHSVATTKPHGRMWRGGRCHVGRGSPRGEFGIAPKGRPLRYLGLTTLPRVL